MSYDNRLDEGYFRFLIRILGWEKRSSPGGFFELANILYTTPFSWVIDRDSNRAQDAFDLRQEFVSEYVPNADSHWVGLDVSVLEVLTALAQRCSFQTEGALSEDRTTGDWLTLMLDNLGLLRLLDIYAIDSEDWEFEVRDILHRWMFREYQRNGVGGIFPLEHSRTDQRRAELWDQASSYLMEELERSGFFD